MPVAVESKQMDMCQPTHAMDMDLDLDVGTSKRMNVANQSLELVTDTLTPKPKDTVIVFDWDDTLLPSTYLASVGYRLDNQMQRNPEVEAGLRQLEQMACTVLRRALQVGNVHIITNAERGWVQLSAQKFIPAVVPLLRDITVISARSTFEPSFPGQPVQWKFHAMQDKLSLHTKQHGVCTNVISFGDSHVEREAVRSVTRGMAGVRTKSVKFAEHPSMEQLRRQIDLVHNCFNYIIEHDGDLDLMLTISLQYS